MITDDIVKSYFDDHFLSDKDFEIKAPSLILELENRINFLNSQISIDFPNEISHHYHQLSNHQEKLKETITKFQQLHKRYQKGKKSYEKLQKRYQVTLTKIETIEKNLKMKENHEKMEELGSYIQAALCMNDLILSSRYFGQLSTLVSNVFHDFPQDSKIHLEMLSRHYHEILNVNICNFNASLNRMGWPFLTSARAKSVDSLLQTTDVLNDFQNCFHCLSQMRLPAALADSMEEENSVKPKALDFTELWTPIPLPIHLMLLSLKKRFYFNFYGNRKTNQLEKPEWYLSQVISYISDHHGFLTTVAQPCADKLASSTGDERYDCVTAFIRGLVCLIIEKMRSDYENPKFTDDLFCHLIDEVLRFQSEITLRYSYPPSEIQLTDLLASTEWFDRWIHVERNCAMDKLDIVMGSSDAWNPLTDSSKCPECTDSFLVLVNAITERARLIRLAKHQAQFMALVDDLLMNFHLRLTQVYTSLTESKHAESPQEQQKNLNRICGIANAFFYVKCTLEQWADDEMLYRLWSDHQLRDICQTTSRQNLVEQNMVNKWIPDPVADVTKFIGESLLPPDLCHVDDSLLDIGQAALESVFNASIQLYVRQCQRIVCLYVIQQLNETIRNVSRDYRCKTSWIILGPTVNNTRQQLMSVSPSAYGLLLTLRDQLHVLHECLVDSLFTVVWRAAAKYVDWLLFNKLIMTNKFNATGGQQLQFDIRDNLIPLFRAFTTKPHNYFRQLLEACELLALSEGSLNLLKDVLHRGLYGIDIHGSVTKLIEDPLAALRDLGIVHIGPDDAWKILQSRPTS